MGLDPLYLLWHKSESNPNTTRISAIGLWCHAVVLRYTPIRQNASVGGLARPAAILLEAFGADVMVVVGSDSTTRITTTNTTRPTPVWTPRLLSFQIPIMPEGPIHP